MNPALFRSPTFSGPHSWSRGGRFAGWACLALTSLVGYGGEIPLRVLVLTGQNNHDWTQTTPKIASILSEPAGRFVVHTNAHPERCGAEQLAGYHVVLSDWNTFGQPAVTNWPDTTRAAFLDFVRRGRGFVVVHAGSSSFYDWPEYQRLGSASWKLGQTSHGNPHAFTVKPVTDHPIVRDLAPFTTTDELWIRPGVDPSATVLATGDGQPVAFATTFGSGRGFTLLLGHSAEFMETPGFKVLLRRGTEWAATGGVTLPAYAPPEPTRIEAVFAGLRQYRGGGDRGAVRALEQLVAQGARDRVVRASLAARLAAVLTGDASADAKRAACEQLSLIGSAEEVRILRGLVTDHALGYHARLALERIPGAQADAALLDLLRTTSGETRLGVISSLAARRVAAAVPALAGLLSEAGPEVAGAAAEALGRIGGVEAGGRLAAALEDAPGTVQPRISAALLRCAEGLAVAGRVDAALPMLQKLCESTRPATVRIAAFAAQASALGPKGAKLILASLESNDAALQTAALRALRLPQHRPLCIQASRRLAVLPPPLQAQLIVLLGESGDVAAVPALLDAAARGTPGVRQAALAALGTTGDASVVPALTRLAATGTAEEKKLISQAFGRLRGATVDAVLIATVRNASPVEQRELVRALVQRETRAAVPLLLDLAKSPDAGLRGEAIAAVGRLSDAAGAADLVPLIEIDPDGVASALADVCRREQTAEPILAALGKSDVASRAALLGVLDSVGGPQALAAVRSGAEHPDAAVRAAAVRAMANWQDPAPLEDLARLAATSEDLKCQVLAVRGVARLAPLAKDRPAAKVVALIAEAMKSARDVPEQRALLAALGEIPGPESLRTAESYIGHPALDAEAKAAAAQIRRSASETAALPWDESMVQLFTAEANRVRGGSATNLDGLVPDGAGSGPAAAIDGDPRTYWDETDDQPLYWLRVELRQPAAITSVCILGYQHQSYAPRDFEVICDGKLVQRVQNAAYEDNLLKVALPSTTCRSVELKISGYYGQSPAIRELGLFGPLNQ